MSSRIFERIYTRVPQRQREKLRRFRATHPPKHLAVGGLDWRYIASGQGKDVLLFLTGGLNYAEYWFQIIAALEGNYRTHAPTYPLAGTVEELVEGLRGVLEAEGVQSVHIVGNSFGGMLAQCFVRRYPDRVRSMVLGDTAPPNRMDREKIRKLIKAFSWIPSWPLRPIVERTVWKWVSPVPEDERDFWRAYFKEYMANVWTREALVVSYQCILDFVGNYAFSPTDLASWPGRVMIVDSDDDQAIGAGRREALKAMYPQAEVHTFHAAGHVPFITKREEYVSVIRNFLSGSRERISLKLPQMGR